MSTEVLLMSDVNDLGAEGDIVKVADGYARNFLLPKKLAAPVTEETRRRLAKAQRERSALQADELAEARKLAEHVSTLSCTIPARASADENLYGSISSGDIASALAGQGVEVQEENVLLEAPIKELGIFGVPIRLHPEVDVMLKVWVVEE